jgi:hypothetical protein
MERMLATRVVVLVALSACGQTAQDAADSGVSVGGGGAGVGGSRSGVGGSRVVDAGSDGGRGGIDAGTGGVSCGYGNQCPDGQYCSCDGFCQDGPETCPGECSYVCGCVGDFINFCNPCIAKMQGKEAMDGGGLSGCTSDGGGPGYDSGVGAYCMGAQNCNAAFKCCYTCNDAGSCHGQCAEPGPNGECAPVELVR